jgi:hypothetical protein
MNKSARFSLVTTAIALGTLYAGAWRAEADFIQTNLVSDIQGLAALTDPELHNPWGISHTTTSPIWVSNQATNMAHWISARCTALGEGAWRIPARTNRLPGSMDGLKLEKKPRAEIEGQSSPAALDHSPFRGSLPLPQGGNCTRVDDIRPINTARFPWRCGIVSNAWPIMG